MGEKTSPNLSVTQEHWKGISQAKQSPVVVVELVQLPVAHPAALRIPLLFLCSECCRIASHTHFSSLLSHTTVTPCFLPFLKYVFTKVLLAWQMGSALTSGGSILEPPGSGCFWHTAALASSHGGHPCSPTCYQNLSRKSNIPVNCANLSHCQQTLNGSPILAMMVLTVFFHIRLVSYISHSPLSEKQILYLWPFC